jgi:spore coat polysaccharide biosynthesis predicted glycosyltransferase SpsG
MEALATALRSICTTVELEPIGERVEADVVVIDSYAIRADDRHRVRADLVVAIDDLQRELAVDLVVDPSPGALASEHAHAKHVLAGAPYAVVDPQLRLVPTAPSDRTPERLVIASGAADQTALEIARRLDPAALKGIDVRVVVGPWFTDDAPPGVTPVRVVDGLGRELAEADVVVTAGGVTLLESLALGRPTIAVIVAENQRRQATGAATAGAVLLSEVAEAPARAVELLSDPQRRRALSAAASSLIDFRGAERIAEAIQGRVDAT